MTQINLFMKQKQTHRKRTDMWLPSRVAEGWSRSLGWADLNYYIQSGQTRACYIAWGTILILLGSTLMEKNTKKNVWLSEWKSLSCDPMDYTVHGILQARILGWVTFPFSRGSSQPRDRTQVSCIAGRFFTSWASREAPKYIYIYV